MRIAIATDCWLPETNGIVVTLAATIKELEAMGHEVLVLTPETFAALSLPYGDRLVLPWYPKLSRLLRTFRPDTVHIATQGMLGLATRFWCRRSGTHFTTAFHTRFPEYARLRFGLPQGLLYRYARWFHGRSAPVLVPSEALASELEAHRIGMPRLWSRGVDMEVFAPRPKTSAARARPVHLFVGRAVPEKNIDAFLRLDVPGTRIVVGDGPGIDKLASAHPDVVFAGPLHGERLAAVYADADVLVFPSTLDTFGLVVIEALACGTPVAAFRVPHLVETFGARGGVALDCDLTAAVERALQIPSALCRDVAASFSWRASTEQFLRVIEEDLSLHRSR